MNNRAVFAGTFDPFTLGHYEIANRASKICDTLFVAVSDEKSKNTRYTLEERIEIARLSLADIPNVKVVAFSGFLVDFMRENDIKVMVRGLRNTIDFEYERNLFNAYKSQDEEVEAYYFMASNEYLHVSSSLVRQVLDYGGDISKYVKKEAVSKIK